MVFSDLNRALLEELRARVHNGAATERGLARRIGISQPHMHNVLKGVRSLSLELMDQVLQELKISVLDLVDPRAMRAHLESAQGANAEISFIPVLKGKIGPGHAWPEETEGRARFRVPAARLQRMAYPVAAKMGDDVRMQPLFSDGDYAVLDQSEVGRTRIDPDALYVIKRGRVGLIRRLRYKGRALYMATEDSLEQPAAWERLPIEEHSITHFVRARATFLSKEPVWEER